MSIETGIEEGPNYCRTSKEVAATFISASTPEEMQTIVEAAAYKMNSFRWLFTRDDEKTIPQQISPQDMYRHLTLPPGAERNPGSGDFWVW